jgi:hypothetical protein
MYLPRRSARMKKMIHAIASGTAQAHELERTGMTASNKPQINDLLIAPNAV